MFTTFRGGQSGNWLVTSIARVKGETLARVPALAVTASEAIALPLLPTQTSWRLAGVVSHLRYVERSEKEQLDAAQAGARPARGHAGGADPDPEICCVVGADAGRAAAHL